MLRVLGTIKNSAYAKDFKNEQKDLINWVLEIQNGMYQYLVRFHSAPTLRRRPIMPDTTHFPAQRSTSCFGNYADDDDSFDDAASAVLLAATAYRLSTLAGKNQNVHLAERTRIALTAQSNLGGGPGNGTFVAMVHFDADGWLLPVVDPTSSGQQGSKSPEAEAFVLMMQSGYRDWAQAGYKGINAGGRSAAPLSLATSVGVVVALVLVLLR